MKTMVVSHDSAARMFMEDVLVSSGYAVDLYDDAEGAWQRYVDETPSLSIVDLLLPKRTGLDLCRRMRASGKARSGIILALSAGKRASDLQAAMDAGADDYIWRPIDGQVIRLRLTVAAQRLRNRSDRDQMEQKLRESETRYRTLFEAAPDAIFLETLDGRILDCNQSACDMYGYRKEEWVGKGLELVLPPDVLRTVPTLADELASGQAFRRTRNQRKDGSDFPCDVTARLVTIGGEQLAIVFVRDRSEHTGTSARFRRASGN